jgi:hypothetical protein
LLAVLFTALNAVKPLQIDDAAYACYARQMAHHPLDPYGFALFWYNEPLPANEVLAPPVLPYAWAAARRLLGEHPLLWHLSLLPWAGLLVSSLHGLVKRFAPGQEELFTAVIILSPALLPSFNLMLDVPALALALTALLVFVRSVDAPSLTGAAWAGLLAGLAMQTKYTAVSSMTAMLLYSALRRRWVEGLVAGLVAAQVFITWELLTALLYGRSHFLLALGEDEGGWRARLTLLPFLASHLGGLAPGLFLLALAVLGAGRRSLGAAAGVVALGYALIALLDMRFTSPDYVSPRGVDGAPVLVEWQLAEPIFYLFSAAGAVALALVVRRLLAGDDAEGGRRDTLFLLLWLGLEVVGFAFLTPFPAARRVVGVFVVLAILVARLASVEEVAARFHRAGGKDGTFSTCHPSAVRVLAAGSIGLGLAFFALDWYDARAQPEAVEEAARWAREHGGGTVWFVGHWGFQFYAERAGMLPVVTANGKPAERAGVALPRPARLRAGDWLVVPEAWLAQQSLLLEEDRLEVAAQLELPSVVPLRTVPCYYGGRTPLEHEPGARLRVTVYRVRADWVPHPPR